MSCSTTLNASLARLARVLTTTFKRNQRRQHRFPATGSLHVLFQSKGGSISSDTVELHDTSPGRFAFLSTKLFCIGHHVCLSDGIEAMEVSIEHRREHGSEYVYVVNLGDLEPLPASWRGQLGSTTNRLEEIAARCEARVEAFDVG